MKSRDGISYFVLVLILAIAAGVRIYKLGEGSFWFDEQGSIIASSGHLADSMHLPINQVLDDPPDLTSLSRAGSWMAVVKAPDVHPPLYPLMLRVWRDSLGDGDATARGFSVLASLVAIVLLFDLGRTLVGVRAALWACAIMAVSQPEIEYAQEARGYMLWTALGLGAAAAAARLIVYGAGWRRTVAMVACLSALVFVHFFAMFTAGAILVWCAIYLRGRALRQTLTALGIAAIVVVPLFAGFLYGAMMRNQDAGWMHESPYGHLATTLRRLAILPASLLAYPRQGMEAISSVAAVAYVLPLFLLKRRDPAMAWCGLWMWAGTLSLALLDLVNGTGILDHLRFALIAAPAYFLLIASLPLRAWLKQVAPGAAVIGCALAIPYGYDPQWKGEWRELGQDVRRVATPADVIVISAARTAFLTGPEKMYQGVAYYAEPIPCPVLVLDKPIDAPAMTRLKTARQVWFVSGLQAAPPEDYLPGWHFKVVAPGRIFTGRLFLASKGK